MTMLCDNVLLCVWLNALLLYPPVNKDTDDSPSITLVCQHLIVLANFIA